MYNKLNDRGLDTRNPKIPKMRKYYQLALALVCIVSVVTLLFYRHEYYRLRYVLEVLNFFGKPSTNVDDPCISSNFTLEGKLRPSFNHPLPTWQRLSNEHYIYSAFWENDVDYHRVHAISVAVENPQSNFGCLLWFDTLKDPVVGKFSFSEIESEGKSKTFMENANVCVYDLYCTLTVYEKTGVPYGVSFYTVEEKIRLEAYIPVHYIQLPAQNIAVLCTVPTANNNAQKSAVIEFLSYHKIVGVSEFIVYNSGPISRVASALTRSSVHDLLGLGVSVLPWNFPFSDSYDISRTAIEHDCLLRTKGKAQSVAIIDWEQYIVPKYHNSLSAMLNDMGKSALKFKLTSLTFCTQLPSYSRSSETDLILLRKTRYVPSLKQPVYIHQPSQIGGATQKILPGIAVVHRYTQCSKEQLAAGHENEDVSMARFTADLGRSSVLKAWYLGKLFE